ncbi:methyltransferase [Alkalimonas collagenimarina]|uniref:Methyltransferase n=1 Tax=Alkalimonas collagenimarina TaxID=400390 RepID=A0ABT9GUD8_9GAMM|nr:methyltransferase [Alkalimonas collagenimarina]MDP4534665.1 methyltransferase [Alkalimonas collagenimarina]
MTLITKPINAYLLLWSVLCLSAVQAGELITTPEQPDAASLQYFANHDLRSEAHIARNSFRNPVDTLLFFEVKPKHQVLEIWPARGWYTEILAPYLKENGQLTIAHHRQFQLDEEDGQQRFWARISRDLSERIESYPDYFGAVQQLSFDPPELLQLGQEASYDRVLSFRNAHILDQEGTLLQSLTAFFHVLKPGGILGMVEHRSSRLSDISSTASEGYLDEAYIIRVAESIGFELLDRSEINANPLDTRDHPRGVYNLPPTLAMGSQDSDKYLAIGESDRMTLKFIKPN